ncbi:MAG TPA: carboxypeptidase-like regulatory domain-containing protein [Thermoanaerobaculia bacterium]|nr:carboxypeptidase-like regulatory domain-containing protein [Thermoanaerobaculia bacterium]
MRRLSALAFVSLLAATAARADGPIPAMLQVLGSVSSATHPISKALVIALNLKDLDAIQTFTAADGTFTLPPLPSGIYKVIAVKQGFAPAIATVLPTKPSHTVKLSLDREDAHNKKSANDEMWQIRASLPPDILRELDQTIDPPQAALNLPRVRGDVSSLTGVSDQTQNATAIAQTSFGVLSRLGDTWQIGVRGNMHRIDDPTDSQRFGDAAAQSSVMSMELRSSPTDSYRVASTRSFWRYRDTVDQADMTSHDVQWEHGATKVGVHYFAQDNLFDSTRASDLLEVSGGTTLVQSSRGDVGVSMRVAQENVHTASVAPIRTADFSANGTLIVAPAILLRYGMSSRTSIDGTELAPRTGAEVKLGKDTALVVSGLYKVIDPKRSGLVPPSVVDWSDDGHVLPRYSYSFGIVSGDENATHLSAIATVSAIETPFRMLLITDGQQQQFWDGLYVDSGDVRHDLRVTCRKDVGNKLAIDISGSAGTATPRFGTATKSYVTGDVQTIFFPTGTSLLISFISLQQPQESGADYHTERVNLRVAQSLHLPLDLKLLLGLELVHAENSPFLLDAMDPTLNGATRRYLGGLAVNF